MENKLIIFDLDGVLIESKMMHFHALNSALQKVDGRFVIEYEDHVSNFNGLPTLKKLQRLTITRGLPESTYAFIQHEKQKETLEWVKTLPRNEQLVNLFKRLKENNTIAVASNSIKETVKQSLTSIGVIEFVDLYLSNQDVQKPKPDPEMFHKCMSVLGFDSSNTFIIEDSPVGIQAAKDSGASVIEVTGPEDVLEKL